MPCRPRSLTPDEMRCERDFSLLIFRLSCVSMKEQLYPDTSSGVAIRLSPSEGILFATLFPVEAIQVLSSRCAIRCACSRMCGVEPAVRPEAVPCLGDAAVHLRHAAVELG